MKVDEIFNKYGKKLDSAVKTEKVEVGDFSRDYLGFKKDMMPSLSKYEILCKNLGGIINLKIAKKDSDKIQKNLETAHLDVSPSQAVSLAFFSFLASFFLAIMISFLFYLLSGGFSFILFFLLTIASGFIFYYFYSMPARLANSWRLKASSQMVPCILYTVAYMKHTSNMERAIAFSAQHLSPPLSLDLRKVFWDVETGRYSNVKDSLDNYLEKWRETNIEFVEAFHLIESSLYEPSEERRIQILERALQVILDGVYEKMLGYSREIRSPLTNLYMLGIVLPTLAIALLPLASTLLGGILKSYHVFILFNIVIPFFVFYMTSQVLLKRPGGYGESDILELNPEYNKFKSRKPYLTALLILIPFLIIGVLPFLLQTGIAEVIGIERDLTFNQLGLSFLGESKLFDFISEGGKTFGPFGFFAVLLSLFIPLGIALFFSYAYQSKTKDIIKTRDDSKNLEKEFTNSLFQLGNRLGDGMPAEIAFAHIASSTRGQVTEGFFMTVNTNIQQLGMSVEQAIFNPKRGAIIYYPSALISTSMKILVESVKKGLQIAARSLMSISEYVKNMQKINERVRDLLAEVVSDMKSNMVFLAPLMAGIVVGLATMITVILGKLKTLMDIEGADVSVIGNLQSVIEIFDLTNMISPYFLQLAIGIYLIEITFILSSTLVKVDAGDDRLKEVYETGKNLKRGIIIYFIVAFVSIAALTLVASVALGGLSG
ncbi:hypothetical protein HYW76_01810 [Candidatus Pacearchaeota archaeon]|nr:hypothetical protein [Candidatus Pacearchaeota archaeon]